MALITTRLPCKDMEKAFKQMDIHGTGTLNAADLLEVAKRLGQDMTLPEIETMVELATGVDDPEGEVTFEQFKQIVLASATEQPVRLHVAAVSTTCKWLT
eukprot:SAG31_NODE_3937_length_3736_cov_1.195766_4_plen_100_part_00